jgi:hypothetical protein
MVCIFLFKLCASHYVEVRVHQDIVSTQCNALVINKNYIIKKFRMCWCCSGRTHECARSCEYQNSPRRSSFSWPIRLVWDTTEKAYICHPGRDPVRDGDLASLRLLWDRRATQNVLKRHRDEGGKQKRGWKIWFEIKVVNWFVRLANRLTIGHGPL